MNDPIVTVQHMRQARICARGSREFAKKHGLDYAHFLNHGYPCSVFEATGDALGEKVVSLARAEAAKKESSNG